MNEEENQKLENVARNAILKMGKEIPESTIVQYINKLKASGDKKVSMELLGASVERFFNTPEKEEMYNELLGEICEIDPTFFDGPEDLKKIIKENKEKNYTPGNIPIDVNHKLIADTLKSTCDKFNDMNVDYYVVGALSTFIATNTELFRYHGDIDFMIAEKDIEKVKEALKDSDYNFSDDRLNNKKNLAPDSGHTQGEHEVIANHKDNEFHMGFFLYRREPDNSITVREYFMQEDPQTGEKQPMVLERHEDAELAALEYSEDYTEYAGTRFRTSTPESVYLKKISTKHDKDIIDCEALEGKINPAKVMELQKHKSTLDIVPAVVKEKDEVKINEKNNVKEDDGEER